MAEQKQQNPSAPRDDSDERRIQEGLKEVRVFEEGEPENGGGSPHTRERHGGTPLGSDPRE